MEEAQRVQLLHDLLLKIGLEIKRVCEACGIRYYLFHGSLLGAVRHQGFIPWDDDMDIAMPRADYEKFIEVFPRMTDSRTFFLENWFSEPDFGLSFSKVKLNGTVFQEHSISMTNTHKGIYVDVCPMDLIPDDQAIIQKTARKLRVLGMLYKFRKGYLPTDPNNRKQHIMAKVVGTVGKLIPERVLRDRIIREETRFNHDGRANCIAALSGPYAGKEVFRKDLAEELVAVPFETAVLNIPAGYHEILMDTYGDYLQLPPKSQQIFKHHPEEIDFGPYATAISASGDWR